MEATTRTINGRSYTVTTTEQVWYWIEAIGESRCGRCGATCSRHTRVAISAGVVVCGACVKRHGLRPVMSRALARKLRGVAKGKRMRDVRRRRRVDVDVVRAEVLAALADGAVLSASEICGRRSLRPGAMSPALSTLKGEGLIERAPGRRWRVKR